MNFGEVPPFWDLGNITAFGMTMAFLYSTTTLPALMAIFPVKTKIKSKMLQDRIGWYSSFGKFVTKQPIRLTVISFVIIGGLSFLATTNQLLR